mmetsp:Transcript_29771/g.58303  ORF Transcript_29771/g.58303 Transcript_29771/m.58303 type:complete len:105 (+) Transcript_29771:293-607(+)
MKHEPTISLIIEQPIMLMSSKNRSRVTGLAGWGTFAVLAGSVGLVVPATLLPEADFPLVTLVVLEAGCVCDGAVVDVVPSELALARVELLVEGVVGGGVVMDCR